MGDETTNGYVSDYVKIREARGDVTDDLLHMTRDRKRLQEILADGCLRPTYAPRERRNGSSYPTIKGPHPAICFTEMALSETWKLHNVKLSPPRYSAFGVAMSKVDLFELGARPVIYDDKRLLGRRRDTPGDGPEIYDSMPEELQYRFVPLQLGYESSIDWTHEREWRLVRRRRVSKRWEELPLKWRAIHSLATFRLFVPTRKDAQEFRKYIRRLLEAESAAASGSRRSYLNVLRDVVIDIAEEAPEASRS